MLLSDVGMAGMDRYTLMRQARSREPEHGGNIPAIKLPGTPRLKTGNGLSLLIFNSTWLST